MQHLALANQSQREAEYKQTLKGAFGTNCARKLKLIRFDFFLALHIFKLNYQIKLSRLDMDGFPGARFLSQSTTLTTNQRIWQLGVHLTLKSNGERAKR